MHGKLDLESKVGPSAVYRLRLLPISLKKTATYYRIILKYEYVGSERIFHNTHVYSKLKKQGGAEASWYGAAHTRYWKPLSK